MIVEEVRDINRVIGSKLNKMRKEKGMTQSDLGNLLGISFQQVQKYEKGKDKMSAEKLYYSAKIFGCKTDDFFN